jgi:hypothetical protein
MTRLCVCYCNIQAQVQPMPEHAPFSPEHELAMRKIVNDSLLKLLGPPEQRVLRPRAVGPSGYTGIKRASGNTFSARLYVRPQKKT